MGIVETLLLLAVAISSASACSLTYWRAFSQAELLYETDIVVTGRDERHIDINSTDGNLVHRNMEFKVYCTLKDDGNNVNQDIIVEMIYPINSCQDEFLLDLTQGKEYMLGLQRLANGNFEWDTVNENQQTAWDLTNATVDHAATVCGLQDVKLPVGGSGNVNSNCPAIVVDANTCITSAGSVMGTYTALTLSLFLILVTNFH